MAILTDRVTDTIYADIVDTITNTDFKFNPDHTLQNYYKSPPWTPIVYDSLSGWLFLNYALLGLLLTLVFCVGDLVYKML